jgi:hypothetical protein
MKPPKVSSVKTIDDVTLLIEFNNGDRRKYSVTNLLEKPMFAPLRNPSFFRNFKVDAAGYGIVWNDEIDLSEYELWKNGVEVNEAGSVSLAVAETQVV